jgi:hypothetical protein
MATTPKCWCSIWLPDRDAKLQHLFDRRHLARLGAVLPPVRLTLEVHPVLNRDAAAQRLDTLELLVGDGFGMIDKLAQSVERGLPVDLLDHRQVAVECGTASGFSPARSAPARVRFPYGPAA